MSEYLNQHYVPRFYFQLFRKGKAINLAFKDCGQIRENVRIESQCSADNFYDNLELEHRLSRIEGIIASYLKDVILRQSLYHINKECIMLPIALQHSRTMKMRQFISVIQSRIIHSTEKITSGNNPEMTRTQIQEMLPSTINIQQELMDALPLHIKLLSDMKLVLIKNDTDKPFIFSDSPCVFFNQALNEYRDVGDIGLRCKGLQIFYPINDKLLIHAFDSDRYTVNNKRLLVNVSSINDIDQLNILQLLNSYRFCYFSNIENRTYVESLWEKTTPFFKSECPNMAVRLPGGPNPDPRYILSKNKSVEFPLRLSFVRAERLFVGSIFDPAKIQRNFLEAQRIIKEFEQSGYSMAGLKLS